MQPVDTVTIDLKSKIRDIPDFPMKGILFRDITPILQDPAAFKAAIDAFAARYKTGGIEIIAAIESRGYIFASALAYQLKTGFVPIRKPGKLPAEKISESYTLEYGSGILEMHHDAIKPGQKVLLVDDLIATGGSAMAAKKLIERVGGKIVGIAFLVELMDLNGRKLLEDVDVFSLIQY